MHNKNKFQNNFRHVYNKIWILKKKSLMNTIYSTPIINTSKHYNN